MNEAEARAIIAEHFATASTDQVASAACYADDAVLEFPQSLERIRGKSNIIAFRSAYPALTEFSIHRTIGSGDLWINEYRLRYDGTATYNTVGIMEFEAGKVKRERLYFAEPFEPPTWRSRWVERMAPEAPFAPESA